MAKHITLGKKGEELARKHLEEKGYRILDTNWRHGRDEVDIIAMDGDMLVIVEVKTRSTDSYGEPEESVNPAKERFLIRATEAYLDEKDMDAECRFDIVSIILNKDRFRIKHIEEAFYPEL